MELEKGGLNVLYTRRAVGIRLQMFASQARVWDSAAGSASCIPLVRFPDLRTKRPTLWMSRNGAEQCPQSPRVKPEPTSIASSMKPRRLMIHF